MSKDRLELPVQNNAANNFFFSIVTVCYNNYDELLLTYESVKNQYCRNFEWIVIDGNSKDNTVSFLQTLKMDNFSFISEKDKSHFDAMNKGILKAKGEFIIFLNSGDSFSDAKTLEIIKNKFDEAENNTVIDFIYGDSNEVDKNNTSYYRPSRKYWRRKIGMFTHHQAMFYGREILMKYGISYSFEFPLSADYDFTLHFLKYSRSYLYVPISVCLFLQGGLSQTRWPECLKENRSIRTRYFNLSKGEEVIIHTYQYLLHAFRYKFTPIYNFLRFSKNK
jgi:putative colanic acid biosynthesis glycosyltransferase